MPGYPFTFVDKLKRKCLCPLCELPMRDPVQLAGCGHRYCDSCLQEFLSDGVLQCPVDNQPLDYAKVYADKELQGEITKATVRCPHYKDGCRWVDLVTRVAAHLTTCRYDTRPCPNQCSAMLSRMCLEDHMQYTCPRRMVTCECCQLEFTGEAMEVHQGNCPKEIVWCENKCGARLQRRYLSNHMNNECHKRTIPCRYCQKEFVYETLQDHYYTCPRFPLTCPNRCDHMKIAREDVERHVDEQCPSATIACTFRDVGCKFMCPRFGLEKHLDDCARAHLSLMCTLALKQERQMKELVSQMHTLSRVTDGTLIWKINNMKDRMYEAKNPLKQELKSEPFYTSRYGYKLGCSVFLNGNGSGEGSYVSLYIRMLPGEYDNLLEWPFRLPISFQLLDQCTDPEKRANLFESFVPNPSWKHFQKPSHEVDAMGFGYPKFVAHDTLKTSTYLKDDAIFIKIQVDQTKFIKP